MASVSTSFSSLISLIFYAILFAVPIKSYPLDNICKQTKSPDFCYNLLNPHSNANLQELDQIVIDATFSQVTKTSAKIQSLLSTTHDPKLRVVYSLCSKYYTDALTDINEAKEKLKSGKYEDLVADSILASKEASSCQVAFANAPSKPIPIASDNHDFDLLSDVLVVVSRTLYGSG